MEHHLEEFKAEHAIDIDDGQIQQHRQLAGDENEDQEHRQLAGDEGEDQEHRQLAGDENEDQEHRQIAGDEGEDQEHRQLAGDENEDQEHRQLAGDEGEDQEHRQLAGDENEDQEHRQLAGDENEDQDHRQLAGDDGQIQHDRQLAGDVDKGEDQHQEHDGKVLHRLCAWRKVGGCVQSHSHLPAACWIKNASGWLIAFAGAALTLSYTMVSSPRGGFWQDDLDDGKNSHKAGEPILESKFPNSYDNLMMFGSMSFLSSLFLVLFLIHDVFYRTPWRMSVLVLTALFTVGCLIGAFIYGQFPQYPRSGAANMSLALVVIAVFIVGNISLWCIYKLLCYVRNRLKQRSG